jgi:copper chaperone NosL
MRFLLIFISTVSLALTSCTVEPEPIRYGEDACHHCKMTLMDKKFGAELVTQKGKIYKFDDVNCMLSFYNSGEVAPHEFSHKLVVDFTKPATLIDADKAFYLKSPMIKSPMLSEVAAFENEQDMKATKDELNGIYLVWGELVTQFK